MVCFKEAAVYNENYLTERVSKNPRLQLMSIGDVW